MKRHKFNWVDGLVLAVILVLAVGTCVKFLVLDNTASNRETVDVTYQIKISGVRQYTLDALRVGDTVYDNEGKGAVGVISEISAEDAMASAALPDGTTALLPVEDRYDVTLTLEAQGTPEDGAYQIGTYQIKVNQYSTYFTKYSIWGGKITGISGAVQ